MNIRPEVAVIKSFMTEEMQSDDTNSSNNTSRRSFLKTATAGAVGAGMLGVTGTARAAANFMFIDSDYYGSGTGFSPTIMLIGQCSDTHWADPLNECGGSNRPAQEFHDHSAPVFEDLYQKSNALDGIGVRTYMHDTGMSVSTELSDLDNKISGHWTDGNDSIKVWDIEEQFYDYEEPNAEECSEGIININDPAMTSSDIYTPVTGFPGDDGQGHNNMHARVRVASVVPGRMAKAGIMALCRIHDKGEWNDSSFSLPKDGSVDKFTDIGSGKKTGNGGVFTDPEYSATALGRYADPTYSMANGPCQRTPVPNDWSPGPEYMQEVTYCAASHVDQAYYYFD